MVKIYIAGPDVFELDSIEIGQRYKKMCEKYNFKGLYPLDNEIKLHQTPHKMAHDIYKANLELIHEADIVIANLNPFRGKEADSGTVWECGYAQALGKRVYGYMQNTQSYLEQFDENEYKVDQEHGAMDLQNRIIENFELPINLMIASSVVQIIEGDFEEALKIVSKNEIEYHI